MKKTITVFSLVLTQHAGSSQKGILTETSLGKQSGITKVNEPSNTVGTFYIPAFP